MPLFRVGTLSRRVRYRAAEAKEGTFCVELWIVGFTFSGRIWLLCNGLRVSLLFFKAFLNIIIFKSINI